MSEIFLNIGGFIIKLIFRNVQENDISFINDGFRHEVLQYSRGFLYQEKIRKADFYIEFVDKLNPETGFLSTDDRKKFYLLYRDYKKNRIISSTRISLFQFQIILKHALYILFKTYNGFIPHSSAVNINNTAHIFIGGSGAGKSTAIQLLKKKYESLAGDYSIIRRDEKHNLFYFYQSPFAEKEWWIIRRSFPYPIKKIFFLKKSTSFKYERIKDTNYIIKKIFQHTIVEKKTDIQVYLKHIHEFVANFHDFYFLYFARDERSMLNLFDTL